MADAEHAAVATTHADGSASALRPPDGPSLARFAAVLAVIAAGLTLIATSTSLWDRDEPRNARAAVEMLRSGDWLVPTFNGELRPDKPPLTYWLMAPGVAALGPTELAVRLPSIVGMTATCALTAWVGAMLFDRRTGWWAMVLLASCPLTWWLGSAATPDGTMLPWVLLSIGTFVHRATRAPAKWHWPVFVLALGMGQLAKGPVALAAGVLTVLGAAWFGRPKREGDAAGGGGGDGVRMTRRDWAWLATGAVGGFAVFAAWGVPAVLSDHRLWQEGFMRHVVGRATEAQEGHGGSDWLGYLALLPVYLLVIAGTFVPGVLLLPGAVSMTLRKTLADRQRRAILLGWVVPFFVVVSLNATKLPHYVFPVFPALAIASAAAMAAWRWGVRAGRDGAGAISMSAHDRDWLRTGGPKFYLPVALGAAAGVPVAGAVLFGWSATAWWALPGLVTAGAAVWAVRWHLRDRPERSIGTAAWFGGAVSVLAAGVVMPVLEDRLKPSPELAAMAEQTRRELAGPENAAVGVATSGYDEPSVVFYLDRPVGRPVDVGVDERAWVERAGPGVLIVSAERLERMREQRPEQTHRVEEVGRVATYNYASHGRAVDAVVVRRLP